MDCYRTTTLAGSSWIWKSWAPPRVKFFAWLAFRKRLWTADRRRRHGLEACGPCWLCDQEEETVDHLLVNCSFAKVIWWNTLSWMECPCTFLEPMTLQQWWSHTRLLHCKEKKGRCGHTDHAHLLGIVEGTQRASSMASIYSCSLDVLDKIKTDIKLWCAAGARQLGCLRRE